jgi:hypothetical protein
MFTVTVSRLPEDCTEEEITAHFGTICPSHKIANISMAFDNRLEIEECTKRGDLIRAKVRAVHVSLASLYVVDFVLLRAAGIASTYWTALWVPAVQIAYIHLAFSLRRKKGAPPLLHEAEGKAGRGRRRREDHEGAREVLPSHGHIVHRAQRKGGPTREVR